MDNFERYLTWTTLTSVLILAAGEMLHDVPKKTDPDVPVIFPFNATVSISNKLCWPNITQLWIEFLHSRSNISKELDEKLHNNQKEIGDQFGDHITQIVTHIGYVRNLVNENKTDVDVENTSVSTPSVHPIQVPLCWPSISTAFWQNHLNSMKNTTIKHIIRLRSRYYELSKNFTTQMIQIIKTVDKISDLTHDFDAEEELLEAELRNRSDQYAAIDAKGEAKISAPEKSNRTEREATSDFRSFDKPVEKESFFKSATVPVLGVVILALLVSNAALYRKLRHQRYRDQPLLHEEEIMSHFMDRNTGSTGLHR